MFENRTSPVASLYAALTCDHGAPSPLPVLRAAGRYALAHDDVDALVRIVSDPRCPADIVAEIAKRKEARLRAAYLTRPDLDEATVAAAVAAEKRATVLAAAASSPSAPAALHIALAADPRRSIQLAVACAPNTPAQARVVALRSLCRRGQALSYSQRGAVADAIAACPEFHDEHVDSLWSHGLDARTRIAASPALSPSSLDTLVGVVSSSAAHLGATRLASWQRERESRAAAALVRNLATNPNLTETHRDALRSALQQLVLGPTALAEIRGVLDTPRPLDRTALLHGVATGPNSDEIGDLVYQLPRFEGTPLDPALVASLAEAAALNPAASQASAAAALCYLDVPAARRVLAARDHDTEFLATVLLRNDPVRGLALSVAVRDSAVAAEVLGHLCSSASLWSGRSAACAVLGAAGYDPRLVAALPVGVLGNLCRLDPSLASAVSALLESHLAEEGFVEVFNSLGESFEGTLEELIDFAGRVASIE